jgi:hypothetical protein
MPRIAPYAGEIKALPQKLQTVYERRVMENMGKPFRLSPTEAAAEARLHIARLQYLEPLADVRFECGFRFDDRPVIVAAGVDEALAVEPRIGARERARHCRDHVVIRFRILQSVSNQVEMASSHRVAGHRFSFVCVPL